MLCLRSDCSSNTYGLNACGESLGNRNAPIQNVWQHELPEGLTKAGGCDQFPGHQYQGATKIKEIDASIAPKSPSEERTNARKALSKLIYCSTDPLPPFLFRIPNECPTTWRASSIPAAR